MSVGVEIRHRVATVTLDDPDRRNALTGPLVDELVEAFDGLESDPAVGAVVITGAPPAFCAGADLSGLGVSAEAGSDVARERALRQIYEGFLRVGRSPLPTVAAVNGPAVGAGMNLALVCDVRIAGNRARFDTRFLRLGLHPGGGHTWMLERALGPQASAALVLFGEVLDGQQAADCGLVWRCVADTELLAAARGLAKQAAAAPADLVRRTKATLRAVPNVPSHEEAVTLELYAQLWSIEQPAFAERLAVMKQQVSGR